MITIFSIAHAQGNGMPPVQRIALIHDLILPFFAVMLIVSFFLIIRKFVRSREKHWFKLIVKLLITLGLIWVVYAFLEFMFSPLIIN